jgi:hypothetical protein
MTPPLTTQEVATLVLGFDPAWDLDRKIGYLLDHATGIPSADSLLYALLALETTRTALFPLLSALLAGSVTATLIPDQSPVKMTNYLLTQA